MSFDTSRNLKGSATNSDNSDSQRTASNNLSGPLLAIGGAEDKVRDRLILRRFVELAGGDKARIAVLPTASGFHEAGQRYVRIFNELGVAGASSLEIREREDAQSAEYAAQVRESTGVFLTGGNQVRIASVLGGTPVSDALSDVHATGVVVAGTSAGASVMTAVMVAGGEFRRTPAANMARMAPGLGLIDSLVIDQHFRERDRVARLVTMVSYNPGLLGVGIDEDTAALILPDRQMEIIGSGSVVIVDGSRMSSNVYSRRGGTPLTITNAIIHFLGSGSRFDMIEREAYPAAS